MDKLSYALGLNIAANLKNSGVNELDATSFAKGVKDFIEGTTPEISPEEAASTINTYFEAVQKERLEKNVKEGKEFLEQNSKKEGITTLDSGLQYEILKEGNGKKPSAADNVVCHYHGTLIDGTIFDSSVQRGEPATFPVNGVIPGWVEALQLMPQGSKWKLYIPSNLAYGERGAGNDIGPNSTLIFEVELLDIM